MSEETPVPASSELAKQPLKVYLAGSIQASDDGGVTWRRKISPMLQKMGFAVLDPTVYEAKELGDPPSVKVKIMSYIDADDWVSFDRCVDLLINRDMKLVRDADFLVAYMDTAKITGGTISELWDASEHCRVPIYAVCYQPLNTWSYWVLRTVRRSGGQVFGSWTDLVRFLAKTYNVEVPALEGME